MATRHGFKTFTTLLILLLCVSVCYSSHPYATTSFSYKTDDNSFDCYTPLSEINEESCVSTKANGAKTTFCTGFVINPKKKQVAIVARFDNNHQTFCKDDYSTQWSSGSGILYDPLSHLLYVTFNTYASDKTKKIKTDFTKYTNHYHGWLREPGTLVHMKVPVITSLNPVNGNVLGATFFDSVSPLTKQHNGMKITGLHVTTYSTKFGQRELVVSAKSRFNPRRPDGTAMICTGREPVDYQAHFSLDLKKVLKVKAQHCF